LQQARGETLDQLEQIVVINAEGLLILRTSGTTAEDCRRGRRVSRTETVAGDALMRRLAELVSSCAGRTTRSGRLWGKTLRGFSVRLQFPPAGGREAAAGLAVRPGRPRRR
jgi:hypothetical protein